MEANDLTAMLKGFVAVVVVSDSSDLVIIVCHNDVVVIITLFMWHAMEYTLSKLMVPIKTSGPLGPLVRTIGPHHLNWSRTIYEIIELV